MTGVLSSLFTGVYKAKSNILAREKVRILSKTVVSL